MRDKLKQIKHTRRRFLGTFSRHGTAGKRQLTMLLVQLQTDAEEFLADHVWVPCAWSVQDQALNPGDTVLFEGRVKEYRHRTGERKGQLDYSFGLVRILRIYRARGGLAL